jgi:hypothetical protein
MFPKIGKERKIATPQIFSSVKGNVYYIGSPSHIRLRAKNDGGKTQSAAGRKKVISDLDHRRGTGHKNTKRLFKNQDYTGMLCSYMEKYVVAPAGTDNPKQHYTLIRDFFLIHASSG